jgi:hypothetical protein
MVHGPWAEYEEWKVKVKVKVKVKRAANAKRWA